MDPRRVLVCSAWPYASGLPHLGNLIGSLLSGDVFARYYRLRGAEVLYVSGSDAHGTRIEYEARKRDVTPAALASEVHEGIRRLLDAFDIRFDNYTTTESETHKSFVHDIYLEMEAQGFIVTQAEHRAYCRHCGKFLADRLISGTCPKCGASGALGDQCDACGAILEPEDLVSPVCSFCGRREIEFRETKHWYLDLRKLAPALKQYVASRGFQGNVHWFTQQMIDDGLKPRAITRDIEWGIPAPFAGAEGKVIYVWGEAALGYVSAVIEHFQGDERWKPFWFGDDVFQIYTIGKDNIPFHSLIFPGQLIASQRGYHLPDQIAATEYLNWIGGEGFSKTRGVGLYCDQALELMPAELWRFYLLYNRPESRDVDFSWEELDKAINGILISNVANLANRIISFVQTKEGGVVPAVPIDDEVTVHVRAAVAAVERAFADGLLGQGLRAACELAVFGNEYFQRKSPWATGDKAALAGGVHLVKALALLLSPYVPRFGGDLLRVLGVKSPRWADLDLDLGGNRLGSERVLFERIDVDAMRARVEPQGGPAVEKTDRDEDLVSPEAFGRVDLRVATIRTAEPVEGSDRLLRLTVDLGGEMRTCVAGLRTTHNLEALVGRQVVVVANLPPRTLRGVVSDAMVLAAQGERLALIGPESPVDPGCRVG
ncbi:MAG: methionine--tRNA ligase [Candidatus Bipolaricaulota bacterium]